MDEQVIDSVRGDAGAETIARLVMLSLEARTLEQPEPMMESAPYLVVGDKVQGLEHLLPAPIRKREVAKLHTVGAFCSYVNRHSVRKDAAVVFVDEPASSFVAVLNYHPADGGEAAWCDHRAVYQMPVSPEWSTWTRSSGRAMAQVEFAQFLEDNLPDIVEPEGAKLLELVKTLQAKKSVAFESAVRLDNGATEFVYLEEIKGTGTKGKVEIPTEFAIGVPPYRGEDPFKVAARLRYRLTDAKLVLWYDLVRPAKVLEHVLGEVRARIAADTGLPVYCGTL